MEREEHTRRRLALERGVAEEAPIHRPPEEELPGKVECVGKVRRGVVCEEGERNEELG